MSSFNLLPIKFDDRVMLDKHIIVCIYDLYQPIIIVINQNYHFIFILVLVIPLRG